MRTTAKLACEWSVIDHVYARTVFITEEHKRSHFLCLFERNVSVMNKPQCFANFLVDDLLNLAQLFRSYFLVMREIETQSIIRHKRTGLVHMFTKHQAKRGMHKMRCRVIAHDVEPAAFFDQIGRA